MFDINADLFPRIFQANITRFYLRVVVSTLDSLPTHDHVVLAGAGSREEMLGRLAKHIDNHTANEARRAFSLILSAVFERQLRIWARRILEERDREDLSHRDLSALLAELSNTRGIDLLDHAIGDTLTELAILANVVRHGDGRSCAELAKRARHLWADSSDDDFDAQNELAMRSEFVNVSDRDLRRYVDAIIRFWGLADRGPFAVLELPSLVIP